MIGTSEAGITYFLMFLRWILSWWKWSFYKVKCQKVEFLCNALYISASLLFPIHTLNGVSPEWIFSLCWFMECFVVNLRWQCSHLKGFFPSWIVSKCLTKLLWLKKLNSHSEQLKGFIPSCTLALCLTRPAVFRMIMVVEWYF